MTTTTHAASWLANPMTRVPALADVGAALHRAISSGALPDTTLTLMCLRVGHLTGSEYLIALHAGSLRRAGEDEGRIEEVRVWRNSERFTEPERIALELADAVLTPDPDGERVPIELYERAARAYDETALTTLILGLGQVCFYLPLALIGKPLPGVSPSQQWRP